MSTPWGLHFTPAQCLPPKHLVTPLRMWGPMGDVIPHAQFQPNWQNYKIAISPAGKIGSTPNFDRVIEPHSWLCGWSRMAKFQFKMADGRHIAKCWNSPTNGPIWMKLGWSHPIVSPICPSWCGCHGNGHCLATAHWTFSFCGRLEAKHVNQFW